MKTLILGIGNVLLGDEGVGVHAVRMLDGVPLPDSVSVLDGGTGGFHLLGHLHDHDRVIMIDAALDGKPTGSVSVLHPRYASDYPTTLTAHDIGLKDLLDAMHLLGAAPSVTLITVSVDGIGEVGTELSDAAREAIPPVIRLVQELAGT